MLWVVRAVTTDLGGVVLVSDVMTAFPAYVRLGATIRRAAEVISVSEVGQLMVLDHDGRFVGSLSEEALVRAILPNFDDVTAAGGTLADAFRVFLERGRTLADAVIDPLVVRDAATIRPTEELARAAIVMIDRGIRRLPVVDDGALVGTLSRADLCRAVIYHS
jgi:CBS domain-containing protein